MCVLLAILPKSDDKRKKRGGKNFLFLPPRSDTHYPGIPGTELRKDKNLNLITEISIFQVEGLKQDSYIRFYKLLSIKPGAHNKYINN